MVIKEVTNNNGLRKVGLKEDGSQYGTPFETICGLDWNEWKKEYDSKDWFKLIKSQENKNINDFPSVPEWENNGVYTPLRGFETHLLDNGFRMESNSMLNVYCSGKILMCNKKGNPIDLIEYGREYVKNGLSFKVLFGMDGYDFYCSVNNSSKDYYPLPANNYKDFINNYTDYKTIQQLADV